MKTPLPPLCTRPAPTGVDATVLLAVGLLLNASAGGRPRRSAPERAELCYQELASIGSNSPSFSSDFKQVYQYIDTPPYDGYVGSASIGIEREESDAPMYQVIEGRPAVGEGHYALLEAFGDSVVSGVEINLGTGEFAYLFFESELPNNPGSSTPLYRGSFDTIAGSRVSTSIDDEIALIDGSGLKFHSHSFYKVRSGTSWRRAESEFDRWLGERRYIRTPDGIEYRPPENNPWVRTVNTEGEQTTRIAGIEHKQSVFCRYA